MRSGTIAFIAGILFLQNLTRLPSASWAFGLLLLIPVIVLGRKPWLRLPAVAIIGFLWALWHAHLVLSQGLPRELEGRDVQIVGHIASIPLQRGRHWRFEFDIRQLLDQGQSSTAPKRIHLNWYEAPAGLSVGDVWRFNVRLKRPAGFMNPGGFDYERWMFSQRIHASGYVRAQHKPKLLTSDWRDYPLQRLRQSILHRVSQQLNGHHMSGIVTALAIGHRAAITPGQWALLRQTGTSHLVAISGLHIGLVAGLAYFLAGWCWRRLGRLPLYVASPKAGALAAMLAAVAYAALAGWSLPTQRALIMVSVAMLAVIFQRATAPGRTLALALLLVLCYDPLAVLAPGLWLSFGAVAVILFVIIGHSGQTAWWLKWGRVQWVVSLGLLPLLITFFQQASLISPLANMFAVPLVSLLVVPLVLMGVVFGALFIQPGTGLLTLAAELLLLMEKALEWLASWPFSQWFAPSPDAFVLAMAMVGTVLMFAPRGWPVRWFGIILLAPLIFNRPPLPREGELWFTLLDVGQGLSAVVQTRQHVLVYDTGPRFSPYFDTGAAVVIPYLRQKGITQLDVLLVSHGDNDHIGGTRSILEQIPVRQVISSDARLLQNPLSRACRAGQEWQWDGVLFQIISPPEMDSTAKENNQSCVLRISSTYGTALLTGDIEAEVEQALLQKSPRLLAADLLVAPHHGSKTSSTLAFIEVVGPEYVLFPVGYRNRYRFPNHQVLQRYQQSGIKAYNSASHGAISFILGSGGVIQPPLTWRQQQQRYWHRKRAD